MRCLSCNYDLSNFAEHRCPECGRAFDPADGRTFASRSTRRRLWVRVLLIIILVLIIAGAAIGGAVYWLFWSAFHNFHA